MSTSALLIVSGLLVFAFAVGVLVGSLTTVHRYRNALRARPQMVQVGRMNHDQ